MIYKAIQIEANKHDHNKTDDYSKVVSVHCQQEQFRATKSTIGVKPTNHLFLTARDAETYKASAI